jgi:hypothetical protein
VGDTGSIIGGVGSALGGAASVASVVNGKSAQEKNTRALNDLIGQTTSDATGIMRQTSPLRSLTAGNLINVLSGGRTGNLRVFAPEREALEQQFTRADENLIANGARGGMLDRSRADLNIARAQAVGGLESDVRRRAFEDALRIGFGAAPAATFPTFQGAQNALAGLANAGAQQQAAGGAGLGSIAGIGALLAMKNGGGGGQTRVSGQLGAG